MLLLLLVPLVSGQPFLPASAPPGTFIVEPPLEFNSPPTGASNAYYYYDDYHSFQGGAAPGFAAPGFNPNQYTDYGSFYPDSDVSQFSAGNLPVDESQLELVEALTGSANVNVNGSLPEGSFLDPSAPFNLPPSLLESNPEPIPEEPEATTEPANVCRWDNQPYEPGSRLDHGSYWFACIDGKFVSMGCFSDLGLRLSFGQTYNVSNGYEMMCDQLKNGSMKIRPKACLHNGLRFMPGDTFQDDFYWYSCSMNHDQISKDTMGCVDAKGNRIASNGIFKQGTNLFQCVRDPMTLGMSLDPVACLHRGKRYDIDQTMIDGLFWYTCKKRGLSFLAPELSGCFYGNRTLKVGDRYYRGGFVYQCQRKPDSSLGHVIVGCLETNAQTGEVMGEKNFGDKWAIGTPPYMFMAYCENNPGGSATQRLIYCIYSVFGKNETIIQPGCYRQVNPDLMVLCYNRGDGALGIDRAGPGELHKVVALNLANCA